MKAQSVITGVFFMIWMCFASGVRADVTAGMVGYWRIDESSGVILEDSVGSADATLQGDATLFTDSQRGQVLVVDGVQDNALATSNPLNVVVGSVLGWAKLDAGADDGFRIMFPGQSMPGGHRIYIYSNFGEFGVRLGNAAFGPTGKFFDTGWHQIALTWDDGATIDGNGDYIAYFDGQPVLATTYTGLLTPATWVSLGSNYDPGDNPSISSEWKGAVDEIGIWNRVLTSQEVLDVFQAGLIAPPPSTHPGDFDGDGDVDGADFVAWQTNFPKANGATLAEGDADADGDVDGADFVVWQTNFPFTPGPGTASVPEPSAYLLCALTVPVLAWTCRWRSLRS